MGDIKSDRELFQLDPRVCRICYSTEVSSSALVSPCKCTGSIKYVHEDCLKAWLTSKGFSAQSHSCELCSHPYEVDSKFEHSFSVKNLLKSELSTVVFLVTLISLLVLLIMLIIYLCDQYQNSTDSSQAYYVLFIVGSSALLVLIVILIVFVVKSIFINKVLTHWSIKNYEPGSNEELSDNYNFNTKETHSKTFASRLDTHKSRSRRPCHPDIIPIVSSPVFEGKKFIGYCRDDPNESFAYTWNCHESFRASQGLNLNTSV
jgi:RING-variant domain